MSILWSESLKDMDWEELAQLYRAAPLGDKRAADLELVFSNSMFRCFAREDASPTVGTVPMCATLPCCRATRAGVSAKKWCRGCLRDRDRIRRSSFTRCRGGKASIISSAFDAWLRRWRFLRTMSKPTHGAICVRCKT
jgi:hypothetical protein